jgi:hypothetical protein
MERKLEKASARASARAGSALEVFHSVAGELEEAAKSHESISAEAHAVADEHRVFADRHDRAAQDAYAAAHKIREFFGVSK